MCVCVRVHNNTNESNEDDSISSSSSSSSSSSDNHNKRRPPHLIRDHVRLRRRQIPQHSSVRRPHRRRRVRGAGQRLLQPLGQRTLQLLHLGVLQISQPRPVRPDPGHRRPQRRCRALLLVLRAGQPLPHAPEPRAGVGGGVGELLVAQEANGGAEGRGEAAVELPQLRGRLAVEAGQVRPERPADGGVLVGDGLGDVLQAGGAGAVPAGEGVPVLPRT